jgi:hypothetical protein
LAGSTFLVFMAAFAVSVISCRASEPHSAKEYLGPLPGVRYFYETGQGVGMVVRGLTRNATGGLLVEETVTVPGQLAGEPACPQTVTQTYGLYTDGARLMRRDYPLNGGVVDTVLLDVRAGVWGNPVLVVPAGTHDLRRAKPGQSECRLAHVTQRTLFGKPRMVLSVKCSLAPPAEYASGIGLIDMGGMKLVRIEAGGEKSDDYPPGPPFSKDD